MMPSLVQFSCRALALCTSTGRVWRCGRACCTVHSAQCVLLPLKGGVLSLLPLARSPTQDAQAASSALIDRACVCDVSAPRGVETDALARMA